MAQFLSAINPAIIFWLVFTIIFVVVELVTVGLTSIWFAAGALVALIAAMLGANPIVQFLLFLIVSVALLFITKPLVKKHVNAKAEKTNADSTIGEEVRIEERVSNMDQTGMAIVHGQEWTVRTEDDRETIEAGEIARVVRISGVKLIVEKMKEE